MSKFIRRWRNDLIWLSWLLLFAIFEGRALLDPRLGDTLSERVRAWFRTKTTPGRVMFATAWVTFAVWFLIHIL